MATPNRSTNAGVRPVQPDRTSSFNDRSSAITLSRTDRASLSVHMCGCTHGRADMQPSTKLCGPAADGLLLAMPLLRHFDTLVIIAC